MELNNKPSVEPSKSNTFCWYPFYQLALKSWGKNEYKNFAPCCNSIRPEHTNPMNTVGSIGETELKDLFKTSEMDKLRSDLLSGVKNKACATCWNYEEKGYDSFRYYSKPRSDLKINLDAPKLQAIDVALGESCNLRCRMCSPGLSNKLRIDEQYFYKNNEEGAPTYFDGWGDESSDPNEVLFYNINSKQHQVVLNSIKSLKMIRATGGETLFSESFLDILQTAINNNQAKDIELHYHTNGTILNSKLIKILNQFKVNCPTFSIDATDKSYEYIRYPMPWISLDNNINKFLEHVNIDNFQISSVVSVFSIYSVENLVKWAIEKANYYSKPLNFDFNLVFPENRPIDICWLPEDMLRERLQALNNLKSQVDGLENIYVYIDTILARINYILNQNRKNKFFSYQGQKKMLREIQAFDNSRGQNFQEYMDPKIVDFLKEVL